MQSATTPPRHMVWGLWVFFTAATVGFVVLMGGLFGNEGTATLAGAGLMAFSTLTYLFIHFWTTAHAAFSAAPEDEVTPPRRVPVRLVQRPKAPSDANPYDFDAPPARAVEHAGPAAAPTPPAVVVSSNGHEEHLVATTAPRSDHIVPATQRRSEWIGGLPIIKQVLGETAPVTSSARPGKTRGQCSNCQTILWAPTTRPIRLRCPQCGKVAWLEK
jgi:hypothetical protein